jgi:Tfp pilus assembly PilM family ATPase/Tfp pilus assembly protein PilN
MIRRCIGIDISPSYLRAVQVSRTGEQFHIEKVFTAPIRRSMDSPSEILRSLTGRFGFDRRADAAISMPNDTVFFKNLETDSAGLEQIQAGNFSVLEHDFPIQPDQIIAQVCSYRPATSLRKQQEGPAGEKWSVLVASAARTSLHETLKILSDAKMHPRLVETPVFAIYAAVVANHPEIMTGQAVIAYIDECHLVLAVTADGNILIVRNIPIVAGADSGNSSLQERLAALLSREVQVSWQRVFGTDLGQEIKIYLVAADDSEYLQSLIEENLHCQTTVVDPYARVKTPADCKADFPICVAEGLALRVLAPERNKGLNFLQAGSADMKPKLNLRKELITCAALVGAIAVFWLLGFFVRLSILEANYARIKNQIRDVFQTTLPQEKNIVNPLVQLEQKLESFRKDYQLFASFYPTALGPLEVLRSVTVNTPSQANLKVDDLLIGADAVGIKGTCDSFESVYEWQRLLRQIPGFKLVDVQNVQSVSAGPSTNGKEPKSGVVRFTIVLSSALSPAIME